MRRSQIRIRGPKRAERLGDEYPCGYAAGFQEGIVQAMLRPEWAQGFYHKLRAYYLLTHTSEDLNDWDDAAQKTARAIPVTNAGLNA